jgi:hypothetical protein
LRGENNQGEGVRGMTKKYRKVDSSSNDTGLGKTGYILGAYRAIDNPKRFLNKFD